MYLHLVTCIDCGSTTDFLGFISRYIKAEKIEGKKMIKIRGRENERIEISSNTPLFWIKWEVNENNKLRR